MAAQFSTPSQGPLKFLMDPAVSNRRRFLSQLDYEDVILGRLDLTGESKDPEPGEDGLVAEISASVWVGNKMYTLSSGGSDTLSLSEWSDPSNPQLVSQITLEGYFTTSVASYGDLLAVAATPEAYESGNDAAESNIIFYSINPSGTLMEVGRVQVGDLADGIAFSADGTQLYVANEGQPRDGYDLDPEGSVSIINLSGQGGALEFDVVTVEFPDLDDPNIDLLGSGIRTGAGLEGDWQKDAEPEYVAAAGDYLFVTLQESNTVARIDLTTNQVDAYIGLGWVDYSQVSVDLTNKDAVDVDAPDGFNPIEGQNVVGLRMADGMDAWEQEVGEEVGVYFITANEGDAREYDTKKGEEDDVLLDEIRNKDLNPGYDNVPGRLKLVSETVYFESEEVTSGQNVLVLNEDGVSTISPIDDFASEGTPAVGEDRTGTPVSFGSRSISIFNGETGELVWDSWMTDTIAGKDYNTSLQNIAEYAGIYDDGRSDDKGVEPESVVIVQYGENKYAVASLERTDAGDKVDSITGINTSDVEEGGLLVVYDVTDLTDVDFITYQQVSRAPEGLEVIEASQSPTGRLLLGVSSEYDSNSVELLDFAAMLDNGNGDEYLQSELANPDMYATLDPGSFA